MNALIAGFGNIFLSDDGFGPAVIRRLDPSGFPPGVQIRDFGTGGMHLALEMLGAYDLVVIVDAIGRRAPPGTVFLIEPETGEMDSSQPADAHAMDAPAVLALYERLRRQSGLSTRPAIVIAGCVPQQLEEGMELTEPALGAVPACIELIERVVREFYAREVVT
ncbi:MAG TPA: hydrogenase maturation protease [Candidatus Baltobacteraceae bacterium]|nr:hydrogenase maturation protease [Candidatus Baltobacteraceae bacterium]